MRSKPPANHLHFRRDHRTRNKSHPKHTKNKCSSPNIFWTTRISLATISPRWTFSSSPRTTIWSCLETIDFDGGNVLSENIFKNDKVVSDMREILCLWPFTLPYLYNGKDGGGTSYNSSGQRSWFAILICFGWHPLVKLKPLNKKWHAFSTITQTSLGLGYWIGLFRLNLQNCVGHTALPVLVTRTRLNHKRALIGDAHTVLSTLLVTKLLSGPTVLELGCCRKHCYVFQPKAKPKHKERDLFLFPC